MDSYSVNVALRANYAVTSYFDQTIQIDPSADGDPIHKHVAQVLTKCKNARTKSQPVEYRVYLRSRATYQDGRKADTRDGWHSFPTVESALTHVSSQATEQLTMLAKIGQDDI